MAWPKMSDSAARNALLTEYEIISDQIIHWDTFFWTKSAFFSAIEVVALGVTFVDIQPKFAARAQVSFEEFELLLGLAIFNLFLCAVWFLTNVRNRQFNNVRFSRAREIEADDLLSRRFQSQKTPVLRLYHAQERALADKSSRLNISSHKWEISIPLVFAIAWIILIGVKLFLLGQEFRAGITAVLVAIVFIVVCGLMAHAFLRKLLPPETVPGVEKRGATKAGA